jgi:putative DNA primase/helicase
VRTLGNALLGRGAVLPDDLQERKAKLDELAKSEAANHYVYEAQGGWLEPGKTFVLSDGAVSAKTTNIIGVSPSFVLADPKGARKCSGTSTSWRDGVGQLSRLSSIMMFTTSAALAAPLLTMTGGESFGFCLYVLTRTGKSVATLVGASLIGIDDKNNLIDWNLTEAHLEQRLIEFNDLLFPIDDLESMEGKDREKYLQLRILAYRLSQGSSKGRHSSFTRAHEGSHGRWKCIALTSAEKSIQDMAALAKLAAIIHD